MKLLATMVLCLALLARADGGPPQSAGIPGEPSLGTFEQLVDRWIELRRTIATEKRTWREQESRWHREIDVLGARKAALSEEIAENRGVTTSTEADRDRLLTEKEGMEQAIAALLPHIDRAEARLKAWVRYIPASLFEPLRNAFDGLPATHAEAVKIPASRRLQRVIALYSQVESLQHRIHSVPEIIQVSPDERRQMDAVYIGLARGFAVSRDGSWAGVGTPGPDGWTWAARPGLADAIKEAVALVADKTPAELVRLPLAVRAEPAPPRQTGTEGNP